MGRGFLSALRLDYFRSHAARQRHAARTSRAAGALLGLVSIQLERVGGELRFRAPSRAGPERAAEFAAMDRAAEDLLSAKAAAGPRLLAGARPASGKIALLAARDFGRFACRAYRASRACHRWVRAGTLEFASASERHVAARTGGAAVSRKAEAAGASRLAKISGANAAGIRRCDSGRASQCSCFPAHGPLSIGAIRCAPG